MHLSLALLERARAVTLKLGMSMQLLGPRSACSLLKLFNVCKWFIGPQSPTHSIKTSDDTEPNNANLTRVCMLFLCTLRYFRGLSILRGCIKGPTISTGCNSNWKEWGHLEVAQNAARCDLPIIKVQSTERLSKTESPGSKHLIPPNTNTVALLP